MIRKYQLLILLLLLFSCKTDKKKIDQIATIASGWKGEVIFESNESYIGWDVEIGDADNDGKNEILCTGCPSSALYLSKKENDIWNTKMMKDNLAKGFPGMGLTVKVTDLNGDGISEVILGTGQDSGGTAFYYTFRVEYSVLKTLNVSRPEDINKSSFTHNLAAYDIDHDGVLEVISAYCGGGEIIRYDFSNDLQTVNARKIYHLSGSGEETLIADVDNNGKMELIVSNSFREGAARVEVFDFDDKGELVAPPRIVIDGYDGKKCFYASIMVGDVNNDGQNEMIVGWKDKQYTNKGTILGYQLINDSVKTKYTFTYEDESLDMSYFEKMMVIADANNDGENELVVSTRGDNLSEHNDSKHFGHVFMFSVQPDEVIQRELIVNFNDEYAESSWTAIGDADNDGKNEIVLATGKGDRKKPGESYVVIVKKVDE